jgi:two-component sensor histidine kinase
MKINVHSIRFKSVAALVALFGLVLLFEMFYVEPHIRKDYLDTLKSSQTDLAAQMAFSLDFTFSSARAELEAIAKLPSVVSMEKKRLDETLYSVNKTSQYVWHYFAVDGNGMWVSHPLNPAQVGLNIPEKHMGWVREVVNEDRTVFLDAMIIPIGWLVSGFASPIRSESGEVVGVLRGSIAVSENETVLSIIKRARVGRNGYAYLVSKRGWLLVHPEIALKANDFRVNEYIKYEPVQRALRGETGIVEYEYEGQTWVAAYRPMKSTGWGIVVQQPRADLVEYAKAESSLFNIVILSTFVFSALIVLSVVSIVIRPLSRVVKGIKTRKFSETESFSRDEIGQIAGEFNSLFSSLSQSEAALKRSLKEKELLLKEIHHRVKNNMSLISSLLILQSDYVVNDFDRMLFEESCSRIKSMSLIHDKLYQSSDFIHIDFRSYIEMLTDELFSTYHVSKTEIDLKVDVDDVSISIDDAIPCGLIINELVTNALKYAFAGRKSGEIYIGLKKAGGGRIRLTVSDNGVGPSDKFNLSNPETIGILIVKSLVEQMEANMTIDIKDGVTIAIVF